jgi:hypothetical protein
MGPQVLRWPISAPIAILDQTDLPLINRNNFFLLDCCRVYFKRELPPDRWRLFLKTGHANLPTPRFRLSKRQQARIAKLRPISLGRALAAPMPLPVEAAENISRANAIWNIDCECGATSASCQRPSTACGNAAATRSRRRSAVARVAAGS